MFVQGYHRALAVSVRNLVVGNSFTWPGKVLYLIFFSREFMKGTQGVPGD
jgi:hypothetical protein